MDIRRCSQHHGWEAVAKVKTITEKLQEQVREYMSKLETTGVFDERGYYALRTECDRVAGKNVLIADARRALLASVSNKPDHFQDAIKNLRANHHHIRADFEEFNNFLNNGYALNAHAKLINIISSRNRVDIEGDISWGAIFTLGAFRSMQGLISSGPTGDALMAVNPLFVRLREVLDVMDQLNIDDISIVRMKEVAGEIMREKNRIWAGEKSYVTASIAEDSAPQLLIEYFVGVTPREAAAMSWDLAERLIDRELDVPGVALNFLGINA